MRIKKIITPIFVILSLVFVARVWGSIFSFFLDDSGSFKENMVLIPGGEFLRGSEDGDADEKPAHFVFVDAFYISKYEVTNEQMEKFDSFYRRGPYSKCDKCPAVNIPYEVASGFARKRGFRLPTESEWERAARGPKEYVYAYGDVYEKKKARTGLGRAAGAVKVGGFPANGFGLYDMTGNVWEWCSDWYSEEYYKKEVKINPTGSSAGLIHVLRGGSWTTDAHHSRITNRFRFYPDEWFTYGFRLAGDASEEEKVKYRTKEIEEQIKQKQTQNEQVEEEDEEEEEEANQETVEEGKNQEVIKEGMF